jgi:photosystem II stability/assembly factor-like uncharacterized protein
MIGVFDGSSTVKRLFLLYWVCCLVLTHIDVFASNVQSNTDVHAQASNDFPLTKNILYLDIAYAGTRLVCVGERGLIVYSDDTGNQWRRASVPAEVLLTAVFFIDVNTGWAVGHEGIVLRTDDGALTWQVQKKPANEQEPLFDVWFQDRRRGIVVGAYGTYETTQDGGKHWKSSALLPDDYHLYAITDAGMGVWFIAGEYGTLLRSLDYGKNWKIIETPVQSSFFGLLALSHNNLLLYGLRGTVLQSLNKGNSWKRPATPVQVLLQGGTRLSEKQAVIVGTGGTVIITTDAGNTFHQVHDKEIEAKAISQVIAVSGDQAIVVGAFGIRRISLSNAFNE